MATVTYKTTKVDNLNIFYREAGSTSLPTLLLLHGHGSSSHVFIPLIPLLTDSFHIVAPDYPGFGQSDMPSREEYKYTFENISNTISNFTETIGIAKKGFAIYVFDYGAPVGFRMAVKHPERIKGIFSQSGNAYDDGLGPGIEPLRKYWADKDAERENVKFMFEQSTIKWSYTLGVEDPSVISPDGGTLDFFYNSRPGALDIQLDILYDYQSNIPVYPEWQAYLKKHQPKVVAFWGNSDPFFIPPGAEAFKRDIPNAYVEVIQSGHYVNDHVPEKVAAAVKKLL